MGEQSVEVVRGINDALGRGDMAGVLGTMADDIKWYEAEGMPYGGLYQGGEAVVQNVFGPVMQDIPNFAVTPEQFISSGDTVAVVARYTGTGKDTGKELDLQVVHVWDVRDGKLAQFRQFADTASFAKSWPPVRTDPPSRDPPRPRLRPGAATALGEELARRLARTRRKRLG